MALARQVLPAALAIGAGHGGPPRQGPGRSSVRQVGRSLPSVVADLSPVLRGWGGYFRRGNSARKFSTLDSYVQERLAILDNAKRGQPGRSWGLRHNSAWYQRLGVYRLSGTVRSERTHA